MMRSTGNGAWLWFRLKFLVAACALLACWSGFGVQAAEPVKGAAPARSAPTIVKEDAPLHIASDRMEVKQKEKQIVFEGHVVVQQEDLTITGKRMTVYGAAGGDAGSSDSAMMDKIDRIDVEGDVRISQQDKIATSDKAVYYHREQKIVLLGDPRVSQGQDTVRGRLITLYLQEERSVVEGGDASPVQAVLHPEKKDKGQGR